jgi:hypothetical protein
VDQLEKLHAGKDVGGGELLDREVETELASIGHELYQELFPAELRTAYRSFRKAVITLQVTSDEPWIPWELIKPYDDGDPDDPVDDDFLCLQFQLTRWLAGESRPADLVRVEQLAVIEAGETPQMQELPRASAEHELVVHLADPVSGVKDASPEGIFGDVFALLERGGTQLLHFSGHAEFLPGQPNESEIMLGDRPFRPRHLTGKLRTRLRQDRPLVYFNGCSVARQGWSLTRLGGWADRWVRQCGCGAFVGPQWSVNDQEAYELARLFYAALKAGKTFGEAALEARGELKKTSSGGLTWLASAVYAHPNGQLVFGKDTAVVRRPTEPVVSEKIRDRIIDHGLFIREKTEGFVGRQWIFDMVRQFVDENRRGYFLLAGEPGIGKSAILARLVEEQGLLHHFNVRAAGLNRAEHFLENVCAQLVARYGFGYSFLPPEATQDARFLLTLLEKAAEKARASGEKVVLLVDALDEADVTAHPEGANPLFLPMFLPEDVYVVATTRPGVVHLRIDCEQQPFELLQDDAGNMADVRAFIGSKIELPGIRRYFESQGLDEASFVDELAEKSQGNFMYLHHVVPAMAQGLYQDRELSTLPVGLRAYYDDHWRLIRKRDEEAWFEYKLPVLVALTVVREPVSIEQIQDFAHVDSRPRVRQVLEEWAQFLYPAEVRTDDGSSQKRYRIYHASFQDFVKEKEEVADERVSLEEAHGKIADVLWRELYPEG